MAWEFRSFSTTQEALDFLNSPPRQGPGQLGGNDGTAQILVFEPGTGTETRTWQFRSFPTAQGAVDFFNTPPQQVGGDTSAVLDVDNAGTAAVFFLG